MQPLGHFQRGALATVRRFLDADLLVTWTTGNVRWDPQRATLMFSFTGRAQTTEVILTMAVQAARVRAGAGGAPVSPSAVRSGAQEANAFFLDDTGRVGFAFDPAGPV